MYVDSCEPERINLEERNVQFKGVEKSKGYIWVTLVFWFTSLFSRFVFKQLYKVITTLLLIFDYKLTTELLET